VPRREQDVTVVAPPSPIHILVDRRQGVDRLSKREGLAVIAAQDEERAHIVRRELLDTFPGPDDVFQGLFVAAIVLRLQVL
jgi:hypothetical protein